MRRPPATPVERAARLSRVVGLSYLVLAPLCLGNAALGLWALSLAGTALALQVGGIELWASRQIIRQPRRWIKALIFNQLWATVCLMGGIYYLSRVDLGPLLAEVPRLLMDRLDASLEPLGWSSERYLTFAWRASLLVCIPAVLGLQAALIWRYVQVRSWLRAEP